MIKQMIMKMMIYTLLVRDKSLDSVFTVVKRTDFICCFKCAAECFS